MSPKDCVHIRNWRTIRLRYWAFWKIALTISRKYCTSYPMALFLVFFTLYVSSGMVSGGALFHTTFGLDYRTRLFVVTRVVAAYTLFSSFLAVMLTKIEGVTTERLDELTAKMKE